MAVVVTVIAAATAAVIVDEVAVGGDVAGVIAAGGLRVGLVEAAICLRQNTPLLRAAESLAVMTIVAASPDRTTIAALNLRAHPRLR